MRRNQSESGQATVEWVGLVLGVALLLGALVAGGREAARGQSGPELGEAIAGRMVCATRDACGARAVAHAATPRAGRAPAALRRRSAPPARAATAARALPKGREALGHAWLACFAYRRFEYEREHPMTPRQSVPLDDAVDIINDCLDPLSFLFG
jgi:hypothetical protein